MTMSAPGSPGSTMVPDANIIEKERQQQDKELQEAARIYREEDFDFDSSSIVDLEIENSGELQMFADLSELVHSLENTFDTITITSSDISEIHVGDETDDSEDDDDLENEWAELSRVEGLVRKELEKQRIERRIAIPSKHLAGDEQNEREHTLYDHYTALKLEEVKGVGFICDKSQFLEIRDKPSDALANECIEFCQPISDASLKLMYFGLVLASPANEEPSSCPPTLPFRTIAFRIRPDKMSGAIMDSVFNAVSLSSKDGNLNLLKRQGSHLRAVVVINDNVQYLVDAQLCFTRNRGFQRQLLLRLYYPTEQEMAEVDIPASDGRSNGNGTDLGDVLIPSNNHLKEACSFLQLMDRLGLSGDRESLDKTFSTFRKVSYEKASSNLRTNFRNSRSVRVNRSKSFFNTRKSLLLPVLSKEDWLPLQASWSLVENIWDGLNASFAQISLLSSPLERSNQIPCLDVHFCMDLFQLSEELMIADLEKAKANLRNHEEKGRHISNIFTNVTRPLFELYNLIEVDQLQETQSDFDVPKFDTEHDGSPIFMSLATKSLESYGILDEENAILHSDLKISQDAVHVVSSAFHAYHRDIETKLVKYMSAQLQKTLYRYRFCIHETYKRLKNAYRHSDLALEESNKFLDLMQQAKNLTSEASGFSISPFLKCQVEGGDCWVTETHLLLNTNKLNQQLRIVEWFHPSSALLFQLSNIQVKINQGAYIQISDKEGKEICQFLPSIPVEKLHLFISIMQSLQQDKIGIVGVV